MTHRQALQRAAAPLLTTGLLMSAAPFAHADASDQNSKTADIIAEVGYAEQLVTPGGTDSMSVILHNFPGAFIPPGGAPPPSAGLTLNDSTKVILTITLPDNTTLDPTMNVARFGNAPAGSVNAATGTTATPINAVFASPNPRTLVATLPAGSLPNGKPFVVYDFNLHIAPHVTHGSFLNGGGVVVTLQDNVGLRVVTPPRAAAPHWHHKGHRSHHHHLQEPKFSILRLVPASPQPKAADCTGAGGPGWSADTEPSHASACCAHGSAANADSPAVAGSCSLASTGFDEGDVALLAGSILLTGAGSLFLVWRRRSRFGLAD